MIQMDIELNKIYSFKGSKDTIEVVSHEDAQAIRKQQARQNVKLESLSKLDINPDVADVKKYFTDPRFKLSNEMYEKYMSKIKRKKLERQAERLAQKEAQQQDTDGLSY